MKCDYVSYQQSTPKRRKTHGQEESGQKLLMRKRFGGFSQNKYRTRNG